MIRINLLPHELVEKRRFEHRIVYVVAAGLAVFLLLGVVFGFLQWQVSGKNEVLQQNSENASQLLKQAQAYEVFQNKEDMLQQRLDTAAVALDGRIDWGRISNELSLVMPSDVWLVYLKGSEEEGVQLEGWALDAAVDVPDVGHKAVAKTLVRLADLELLDSVWLTFSGKDLVSGVDKDAIRFTIETGVVRPTATTTATASVPAPPNQSTP